VSAAGVVATGAGDVTDGDEFVLDATVLGLAAPVAGADVVAGSSPPPQPARISKLRAARFFAIGVDRCDMIVMGISRGILQKID
jgi:hypothetical protein